MSKLGLDPMQCMIMLVSSEETVNPQMNTMVRNRVGMFSDLTSTNSLTRNDLNEKLEFEFYVFSVICSHQGATNRDLVCSKLSQCRNN